MRALEINKRTIYYSNPTGEYEPVLDENGHLTGEYRRQYGEPVKYKINVSPAKGQVIVKQFGEAVDYDKIMVTGNLDLNINEESRLWIDEPYNPIEQNPHDYIVRQVRRDLTTLYFAIRKVDVNG